MRIIMQYTNVTVSSDTTCNSINVHVNTYRSGRLQTVRTALELEAAKFSVYSVGIMSVVTGHRSLLSLIAA